jgi:hypothetical protein
MSEHTQATTTRGFEVDEKLLGLLELIWERGIETDLSCQGTSGRAWISFSTMEDARKFVSLAVPHPLQQDIDPDSLYNRAYRVWEMGDGGDEDWMNQKGWLWDTFLENTSYDPVAEADDSLSDRFSSNLPGPIFTVIVRFPEEDIPQLEGNLLVHALPCR